MQKIIPTILTKKPAELKTQLTLLQGQTKWVQIDIMDGKFVPSVSVSISQLKNAQQFFNLEIHLMVQNPENYFKDCELVGAKRVYFHLESTNDPAKVLSVMKKYSFQKGIALNPETNVTELVEFLNKIDAVLLLSVVPGVQGRKFISSVTEKIPVIRAVNPEVILGMDGGIKKESIKEIFGAGVNYVTIGSSIWKSKDPIATLRKFEEMIS